MYTHVGPQSQSQSSHGLTTRYQQVTKVVRYLRHGVMAKLSTSKQKQFYRQDGFPKACLLNFKAHALQSELNQVSISHFLKFGLQRMCSKIEQELKKKIYKKNKNRAKKTLND